MVGENLKQMIVVEPVTNNDPGFCQVRQQEVSLYTGHNAQVTKYDLSKKEAARTISTIVAAESVSGMLTKKQNRTEIGI